MLDAVRTDAPMTSRRRTIIVVVNLTVGIVGLWYLLRQIGGPAVELLARRPSWLPLAAVVALMAVAVTLSAIRWRSCLPRAAAPPILRMALFRAAGHCVEWLVPSGRLGGDPLRVYYLVADGLGIGPAGASVAVDRTLEMAATSIFASVFAVVLLRLGAPGLIRAMRVVWVATFGILVGATLAASRLRAGKGLVTPLVQASGLAALRPVRERLDDLRKAESTAADLVRERSRMALGFALGFAVNLLVLLEIHLLLAGFGLPSGAMAVFATAFASGAAHSLPVPAGVGALEGAVTWLFVLLGHPAEVGLAAGLAMRLREVAWVLPGMVYLACRGVRPLLRGEGVLGENCE